MMDGVVSAVRSTLVCLGVALAVVFGISPTRAENASAPDAPPATSVDRSAALTPQSSAPTDAQIKDLIRKGLAATVRVDRVLVPAVVTGQNGKPVLDLEAKDFVLTEERVPQRIDFFEVSRRGPVSLAFLVDISGSMRLADKLGEAREAIRYFLNGLTEQDRASVLTFADDTVETIAPFGTRPDVIMARLLAVRAYGQTALHDALAAAPGLIDDDDPARKAIILVTDGIDTASRLSIEEATLTARRTGVPVYAIGFSSSSLRRTQAPAAETGTNADVLRRIAAETGGAFFWIDDPDELKEAVIAIEEDLRTQYVLGYTPTAVLCDGSFRQIDLKVGKDRYRIRARRGYIAGPC